MNLFYKSFLALFYIFFLTTNSFSSGKIAFVDVDYLIQNSLIGKKMLSEINDKDKKNLLSLQKKNKILKDLEIEINNKKNVISDEAFKIEVVSFRKKVQDFTSEKNKLANEFNDFKKKKFEDIFEKISPIINRYLEKNSYDILFDKKSIFIGKPEVNLTKILLEEINKELK